MISALAMLEGSAFEFLVMVLLSLIMTYLVGGSCLSHFKSYLKSRPSPEERFELQLQKNNLLAEKLQQKLTKTKSAESSIEVPSTDGEEKQECKFFKRHYAGE